jgi:hypothetical protein
MSFPSSQSQYNPEYIHTKPARRSVSERPSRVGWGSRSVQDERTSWIDEWACGSPEQRVVFFASKKALHLLHVRNPVDLSVRHLHDGDS